jgi:hypothetical protein
MKHYPTFTQEIYALKAERTITEFMPYCFINIRKLNSIGVTATDLEGYCERVWAFVPEGEYFTIAKLSSDGFSDPLSDLGFEDHFYASVLLEDRDHFSYQRIGGVKLLKCGEGQASIREFLESLVRKLARIYIYDLEDLLRNEYGIELPPYKLTEFIRETDLYYDPIMQAVYDSYETYWEEI